jgi:hypothetical protein
VKLICEIGGIRIVPENRQDHAYIRHELGLAKNGDSLRLVAFVAEFKDFSHIVDRTAGAASNYHGPCGRAGLTLAPARSRDSGKIPNVASEPATLVKTILTEQLQNAKEADLPEIGSAPAPGKSQC